MEEEKKVELEEMSIEERERAKNKALEELEKELGLEEYGGNNIMKKEFKMQVEELEEREVFDAEDGDFKDFRQEIEKFKLKEDPDMYMIPLSFYELRNIDHAKSLLGILDNDIYREGGGNYCQHMFIEGIIDFETDEFSDKNKTTPINTVLKSKYEIIKKINKDVYLLSQMHARLYPIEKTQNIGMEIENYCFLRPFEHISLAVKILQKIYKRFISDIQISCPCTLSDDILKIFPISEREEKFGEFIPSYKDDNREYISIGKKNIEKLVDILYKASNEIPDRFNELEILIYLNMRISRINDKVCLITLKMPSTNVSSTKVPSVDYDKKDTFKFKIKGDSNIINKIILDNTFDDVGVVKNIDENNWEIIIKNRSFNTIRLPINSLSKKYKYRVGMLKITFNEYIPDYSLLPMLKSITNNKTKRIKLNLQNYKSNPDIVITDFKIYRLLGILTSLLSYDDAHKYVKSATLRVQNFDNSYFEINF